MQLGSNESTDVGPAPGNGGANPPVIDAQRAGAEPKASSRAWTALTFSLLGLGCLPAVGPIIAITLGLAARDELPKDALNARLRRIATSAIALGALGLFAAAGGLTLVIAVLLDPTRTAAPKASAPFSAPAPTFAPTAPPTVVPRPSASSSSAANRDESTLEARFGSVVLVDLGAEARRLRTELEEQRALAARDGAHLVVWTERDDCRPCDAVSASLLDDRVQRALAKTRLVRVDVAEFAQELNRLGIPLDHVPGFAIWGDGRPTDYIHGGEWDDDVPANIAPVLGRFLRGELKRRRFPHAARERSDETAL
jgi:hypothetical protein